MEGNSWSPSVDQPKIQIAEYSLSVGPTKSENEAVKVWVTYLLLVEPTPCPILLKKRRTTAGYLLQRDKSNRDTIFKLLQASPTHFSLHSTGNHEFWYCLRSRFLHNSSEITGSNQNAWEMEKHDGGLIIHAHSSPKKDLGRSSHGPYP
jgi:hypothetical protein